MLAIIINVAWRIFLKWGWGWEDLRKIVGFNHQQVSGDFPRAASAKWNGKAGRQSAAG